MNPYRSSGKHRSTLWSWAVRSNKATALLGGLLTLLFVSLPAFSQGNTGRILGTVTDQSGGVVSGATVSVIDTARGITRTLTTDDAGEYNAPNLIPGTYTVRAEAKGFKRLDRQNVVVEVGKEVRVDLTVQPGEQQQTVTVTEAVPLVETTNATLGGTLENSEITDLPLNGRDYQNLLSLRPGVMLQPGGGPFTQSTNGVRPDESVWMIDGVVNHNFFDTRPIAGMASPITDSATILPIDAIQEFNLMESPKAEYGWGPGAVVNVGIKSGTNSLHGSAYGFYRSAAWDARNYFNFGPSPDGSCILGAPINGVSQCAKTAAQLKQFGGSVGGPIIKDKLFFFANYEGLRDAIGNAFGTTGGNGIPETGISNGDTANNMVAAINADSAAGLPISAVSLKLACPNAIGQSLPLAASFACTGGYYPTNPSNSTGFLSTFPNVNRSDNGVAKIDYHINDKNTVNGDLIIGNYYGTGEDRGYVNPLFLNGFVIDTWTASGNWDYTPNSRMVNEVRFGYDRLNFQQTSLDAGIQNPVNTGATVPGLPSIQVDPFGTLGTFRIRPQQSTPNPYWDIQESLSYLVGKHSLKFGGEFAHIEGDSYIPIFGRGLINFFGGALSNAAFTCPPPATGSCSSGLEDFFAGYPAPGGTNAGKFLVGSPNRRMLWTSTSAFAQDDWRLTPKLTINLGLRYTYDSPLKEANNLWANFDPNSPTGLIQQGTPGEPTMWKPNRGNFSPRVGFAYDLNGKGTTVVRGGLSLMYSEFSAIEWMSQNQFQNTSAMSLGANPTGATYVVNGVATPGTGTIAVAPFAYNNSQLCWDPSIAIAGSACSTGQATVFPSSATIQCGDHQFLTGGGRDPGQCAILGVDPNLQTPYVVNYNLGVTHAFTNNLSLEVSYVGNHGARLTGYSDVNACAPNATGTCVRPYAAQFPYFSFINVMTNDAYSNYNSLQVTLTKRMSHGLSFLAGYTYAHGLDNGSLNRFGLLPQNPLDPNAEYGNSDFDVRHRVTFTATYNIPGIKGFAQMLEGWQLNGILSVASAQPWTVNDYTYGFSGNGDNTDRWSFFGNPADFNSSQISIPWCGGFAAVPNGSGGFSVDSSGASCSQTYGITNKSTVPANSSTFIANCAAQATKQNSATTLQKGGCFASGNSIMLPPAAGTYGNMGRNIFRDYGFRDMDVSLFKNFTFKERYAAQFRLEIFNLFNTPIFANPYGASNGSSGGNNDPSAPAGFGGAIGTPDVVAGNPLIGSGSARDIQVGLKLTF